MSNVDTPKILFSGPVHLVKTDTLPDVLLEGRIYVVESTGQQTLVLPGGETAEVGTPVPTTSIYQFREAASGATDSITAGAWRKVPLATAVHEGITGASLSGGTVTLAAGTYIMRYRSQAFALSSAGDLAVQVRLYDGSAEVAGSGGSLGQGGEAGFASVTDVTAISRGVCKVTLTEETTIDLEIQTSINATYGGASYASQVCAELEITKVP